MNAFLRSALILPVLVPLAVCVFGLRFGFDFPELRQLLQNARRCEQLDQSLHESVRRQQLRKLLAKEVVAQRCGLSEALEQMEELNREWHQEMERECPDYRQLADQCGVIWCKPDWSYWKITLEIREILRDRPEEADALLRRLAGEHQRLQEERQPPSSRETSTPEQEGSL
jgi:hypothetical protein